MWMHGIFGSQGMIWWWILRLASSHLQKSPQETRNVIYLLAPAIQILPASHVYDRYSCASLLLGSFTQACMHKTSSLPTDLPPTSFWRSNLFDSRWSRCSHISQSSPHDNTLFRCIGNVQHSAGLTLPLTKGLGQIILFPPPFFFFIFLCKRKLSSFLREPTTILWTLALFHINVGIIVMHGNLNSSVESSRQQHVPSSSIFGPLKGLSPYLLTRDRKISCVTTRHLLSSVVRTRGPKTKHTIFACHHS
jgi:hypothetical protein